MEANDVRLLCTGIGDTLRSKTPWNYAVDEAVERGYEILQCIVVEKIDIREVMRVPLLGRKIMQDNSDIVFAASTWGIDTGSSSLPVYIAPALQRSRVYGDVEKQVADFMRQHNLAYIDRVAFPGMLSDFPRSNSQANVR